MFCCLKYYVSTFLNFLSHIVYALGWLTLAVIILKICLGREGLKKLRNYVFAFMLNNYVSKSQLRIDMNKLRERLFKSLNDLESSKSVLQKKHGLDILEIGVGAGANLEFYPAGSRLVCVDPNHSFQTYFQQTCAQKAAHLHPDIRFLTEPGEDMVSVPDASADVVVLTLVLCSVHETARLLREVRRVLVPGGKLFFLEHVADEPGTLRRCIQNLLSDSDLWPAIMDGCTLNREPAKTDCYPKYFNLPQEPPSAPSSTKSYPKSVALPRGCPNEISSKSAMFCSLAVRYVKAILQAGFSSVEQQRVYLKKGRAEQTGSPPTRPFELVNPLLYGVATK